MLIDGESVVAKRVKKGWFNERACQMRREERRRRRSLGRSRVNGRPWPAAKKAGGQAAGAQTSAAMLAGAKTPADGALMAHLRIARLGAPRRGWRGVQRRRLLDLGSGCRSAADPLPAHATVTRARSCSPAGLRHSLSLSSPEVSARTPHCHLLSGLMDVRSR